MKKVISSHQIPKESLLCFDSSNWDYIDCYTIHKKTSADIDKITTELFQSPQWVKSLMQLRNLIVKFFGLKTEAGDIHESDYYPVGSRAVIFTVSERNSDEIVASEDDKHLLFKVSAFKDKANSEIHVTTAVKFHNKLGKVYFTFIKPFHLLILRSLTKRLIDVI